MVGRLLFVHAHPDDESLWTGGLIAAHLEAGGDADLVVCTWAEGTRRHLEVTAAAKELGLPRPPITLGYADDRIPESAPGAPRFSEGRFDTAVRALVAEIRRLQPDAIVTYDAIGVYGHPDHIHAHRLAHAAATAAAVPNMYRRLGPAWQTRSIYEVTGAKWMVDLLWATVLKESTGDRLMGTPDDQVVTVDISGTEALARKSAAIAAHVTEMDRSRTLRALMSLEPTLRTTLLSTECFLRKDLVTGGYDLDL